MTPGPSPRSTDGPLLPLAEIRRQFPALSREVNGRPVAYFDGPGGTQVPEPVIAAISNYLRHHCSNRHWCYPTAQETERIVWSAREAVADLLHARPEEVAFGQNMTTLTFQMSRALGRTLDPGDEIVVTELDHQANVGPWQALERERRVVLRTVPFDPVTFALDWSVLESSFSSRTRLLAIGAASNALGTITDIRRAAALAHRHGALCFVDAVHYAAHRAIDVQEWDCDFLVCSAYKFYGPHIGILWGKAEFLAELDVPKLAPASNAIPDRWETGTQNHEGLAALAAAIEFLSSLSPGPSRRARLVSTFSQLHSRGDELCGRLWQGLSSLPGVRCFGPLPGSARTPTVAFTVAGHTPADLAAALAADALFLSYGSFYATGVMERLGFGKDGLLRAGCACYTSAEEIDRLVESLARLVQGEPPAAIAMEAGSKAG